MNNTQRSQSAYTQRNLFGSLLNETEIRLYLPFSDWFGAKRTSVWFKSNRKTVNTIRFQFDLLRFRKDFSVCVKQNFRSHAFWDIKISVPFSFRVEYDFFRIKLIIWLYCQCSVLFRNKGNSVYYFGFAEKIVHTI